MPGQRGVALLGSTGSIGLQTLDVLGWHPERFRVVVLAAGSDSAVFQAQVRELRPAAAVVGCLVDRAWRPEGIELGEGAAALAACVERPDVDLVVVATSGMVSLRPTLAALRRGKIVAVANKEVLVSAGGLVTETAQRRGGTVLPIDSEHSAIWQCLRGEGTGLHASAVRRIILTASGGAFRDWPPERLADVTPADALRHPNWAMGPKITVDSATLMNKGLEVLEAAWLFEQPLGSIEVVVHRESIIHSMVEFIDRSVKAQLGTPDMRLPIQYALAYPERLPTPGPSLDLLAVGRLTFEPVDHDRFPGLGLAYEAGRLGGTFPAVLSAANEEAVRLFLGGCLPFNRITHRVREAIEEADGWARRHVRERSAGANPAAKLSGPARPA
jgi:1-deoxy-D-xylulose-5-phosphate reductoisomerase